MKTKDYAITKSIKDAAKLAAQLVNAEDAAIGEITGETGTGKTATGRHIVQTMQDTYRVCCYEGMSKDKLLRAIALAVLQDKAGPQAGWLDKLLDYAFVKSLGENPVRPLLVVDECNKATWRNLETLRYLADECGWAVLLIGTELYTKQFADARTLPLLRQLGRRIGSKRVILKHLDRAQTITYIIKPRFGEVNVKTATNFWHACRKGNWGEAVELADACRRVMDSNDLNALDDQVLNSALASQANAQEGDGDATN